MSQILPAILVTVGLVGLVMAGRKNQYGWLIGLLAQVLWIIYAVVTAQYVFIVSALAYAAVYGMNYIKWDLARSLEKEKL